MPILSRRVCQICPCYSLNKEKQVGTRTNLLHCQLGGFLVGCPLDFPSNPRETSPKTRRPTPLLTRAGRAWEPCPCNKPWSSSLSWAQARSWWNGHGLESKPENSPRKWGCLTHFRWQGCPFAFPFEPAKGKKRELPPPQKNGVVEIRGCAGESRGSLFWSSRFREAPQTHLSDRLKDTLQEDFFLERIPCRWLLIAWFAALLKGKPACFLRFPQF